jgi:hypothetical protein
MLDVLIAVRAAPQTMAALAKRRMRRKFPLLEQALTGLVHDHHRRLLTIQLAHIDFLDEQIEALGTAIAASPMALSANETASLASGWSGSGQQPCRSRAAARVDVCPRCGTAGTIPGVDRRGAELILAESGIE